jgi:hypothetical protein
MRSDVAISLPNGNKIETLADARARTPYHL